MAGVISHLFGLLLLTLITSCAHTPLAEDTTVTLSNLPPRHELTQVPFFPQQRYQCGPAALATVLNWSGKNVTPEELIGQIYTPELQGSLQVEILAASRRHARIPYRIPGTISALLSEVAGGNPVLVLQNLGLSWLPRWHYAVVVGYDLPGGEIILRSAQEARHSTALNTFLRTWARSKYWGIVVLPPDHLPETVRAESYLHAVLELERIRQWTPARRAYRTALSRWPDNLTALTGLGNTAYQRGDLASAEQAFRRAIQHHPDSGGAHNNLAIVLLALGKRDAAERHVRIAIQLGGQHLDSYRDTLARINRSQ